MFNSFFYSIKQAFLQMFRNRAMSLASLFSITAMLLILGFFFVFAVNLNIGVEAAKQDYGTIQIYLLDETTEAEAQIMIDTLNRRADVADAIYLSKEDAMAEWSVQWGEDAKLLQTLGENPLPNSIVVEVDQLEDAEVVAGMAEKFDGVEDVLFYKDTVAKLVKITDAMQVAAVIIMLFLVVVSVVVVSNTVKLTVLARSREIGIMKYVGATNWFIRGPFLIEGILIGLFSAGISVGLVALIYSKIIGLVGSSLFLILQMPMVSVSFTTFNLTWIFIALGVSIGACGSIISMRRFLDT